MSDFIEEKLLEWGLLEYVEKFKEEQINEQAFLYMPESMIKELIPVIGKRFCFLQNRKKLLLAKVVNSENEKSDLELTHELSTSDSEDTVASSSSLMSSFHGRGKNLRKLLSESSCGQKILSQPRLTPSDRNKICDIIIDTHLSKSKKITSDQFHEWCSEITSVFKHEKASTYYVPSNAKLKRLANGKLWDKYNNLKRYIQQHERTDESKNIETNPDFQEVLLKLRAIQPDDPNLENLWRETFNARNRGSSIANYYEEYPILKTSIATSLIRIDCSIATGIDTLIFQKKWPEICPYIIQIAENKQACPLMCDLKYDVSIEVLSLFILPYLLDSSYVKTGNKKKWKPSKVEVAESFICRIPNIAQLEPTLQQRKEKLQAVGLTLQPTVITVGSLMNLTAFYVLINDVKYSMTSLPNAIDLCFQAFFALDARYPVDCERVWYFLQQHVYCITSEKYSRNFISVDLIWHDINEIMETSK